MHTLKYKCLKKIRRSMVFWHDLIQTTHEMKVHRRRKRMTWGERKVGLVYKLNRVFLPLHPKWGVQV